MPSWLNSKGRKLLLEDIRYGRIPSSMSWQDAYNTRTEFAVCPSKKSTPKELFSARLQSARKIILNKNTRSTRELMLLKQDLVVRPPAPFNHRGVPRWEGSVAQQLLKKDVAEKKHVGKTRGQFHQSRDAFKAFSKEFLAKKVEQEVSLIKFRADYGKRRSKKRAL